MAASIELLLFVIEAKMILAELGLQTVSRTDEDQRCKCENNPNDPLCDCKKIPFPHRPPRAIPPTTVYDRRVDVHHACADGSGNSYGGMDVKLINKQGDNISVDLFSETAQLACEVKISFKNEPYDPFTMERWMRQTMNQLQTQKRIAESCGWSHCVIVNKPWMRTALEAEAQRRQLAFDVRANPTCGSGLVPPEPVGDELPFTPLDVD